MKTFTAHAGILLFVFLAAPVPVLPQSQAPVSPEPRTTTEPEMAPAAPQSPTGVAPSDARDPVFYPGDTERFKPLVHKLAANLWLDQKEIWTSPFHMHSKDAKWWLGFGAITAALVATDHRTSNALENSQGQLRWANRVSNIGASYTLIPLVAGFYGYGVLRDDPKPREVGVLGTEALVDSLIVVEILKTVASRNRPDSTKSPGKFFAGGTGFPSGHAIESWALASLIAHEYQRTKIVPIVAYGLAAVVSASRFTAQKHFAGDIVAGGAMGWFIGRYVYQTHMDHSIHHHAWLKPQISPQVLPGSGTYMVTLSFGN